MATRRWLLSGLLLVGLVALAVPAPTRRPAAPPAAPVYPRYAQATTPLDHWQRRAQPVLVADQPWEQGVVAEPTVLYDRAARLYRLWYFGGWMRAGVGYAWSRDGVRWHKHQGPVVGLGAGGWAGTASHSSVLFACGLYYLYFAADPGDGALHLATSRDGVRFRTLARPVLAPTAAEARLANTAVWHDGAGWHMLYEAWTPAGIWEMGLAAGRDPAHWQRVRGAFPLRSLQVGGGAYGGPSVTWQNGQYHLWYHAARSGNLPTDVYHATSRDLMHWHPAASGPVLPRALAWEVDQTADAWLVPGAGGRGERRLLYYAGMDNSRPAGWIGLARDGQRRRR